MILKFSKHIVKGYDGKEGIVEAYASVYDNEDSDGDIITFGSYRKTVQEQQKKIRVFKDHDRYTMLGVPIEINAEDPAGLLTTTKFNMEKQVSRDMLSDIILMAENGMEADLSVGIIPVKRDQTDSRKITENKLKEYSFLSSWGANDKATVTAIKNAKESERIIQIICKAYDLPYSDTRLKQLEQLLESLEAAPDGHSEPKEKTTEKTIISKLLEHYG